MNTPTELSHNQLLVFNTMCFLQEHVETPEDLGKFIAAFEHDKGARDSLMATLTVLAEAKHQKVFTTPPAEEQH